MIDLLRELAAPRKGAQPASAEAPGDLDAYKLAYEEAVRAIEGQRGSVDEVRSRAGVLLSAASLVAGFLGPSAIAANAPSWITLVASGLLLAAAILTVIVLLPSGEWRFTIGTKRLLGDYIEADPPASAAELYRSLAWHLESDWESNRDRLHVLYRLFAGAAVCVAGETIFWLVAITQRGS